MESVEAPRAGRRRLRFRQGRVAVVTVVAALAVGLLALPATPVAGGPGAASAEAGARAVPVLRRPTHHGTSVTFRGRARPRTAVRLQVRGSGRWTTVAVRRSASSGRFSVTLPAPQRSRVFRAVAAGRASQSRRVRSRSVPVPAGQADACGPQPLRPDGSSYSCSFHDDFDGTTLDRTRWTAQDTSKTGVFTGQGGCYRDNPRTIGVEGGTLRLTATIHPQMFLCKSSIAPFTTRSEIATVTTTARFTQTYGRFSARMRFSAATGGHAAFWLSPEDHAYGKWPLSGEIDVAEWFGNDQSHVYPSVHYLGEGRQESTGRDCAVPGTTTGFHTYTVEWTPTLMTFFYDDQLCWSHRWVPTNVRAPAPFDKPFSMVLAQIWGSGWAARRLSSPTTSTLEVDWVRVWQ
jgi:hypothetical protein